MNKQIVFLFALIFSLSFISLASAIPPEPMAFYGGLNYTNGTAIPNGYYVVAKIGTIVSGECEVISSSYGRGSHTCVVSTYLTSNPKVEFFLGENKIGEAVFQGKEIIRLDFTTNTLPARNLPPVSNGICEPAKGECSYNIMDCDNSLTKSCVGNSVCDANIGETCSNTPGDCGACSTTTSGGGSSGGSGSHSSGGGSSGGSKVIKLSTTNKTDTTNSSSGSNDIINENKETSNSKGLFGITGLAVGDFVKTPAGKGVLIFVILLVLLGIFASINKNKVKTSKTKKIKVTKLSDMKAIRADKMKKK
jgi:uncharacterized membrane protein YgcG